MDFVLKQHLVKAGFYKLPNSLWVRCHVCRHAFRLDSSTTESSAAKEHRPGCRALLAYQFHLCKLLPDIDSQRFAPRNE